MSNQFLFALPLSNNAEKKLLLKDHGFNKSVELGIFYRTKAMASLRIHKINDFSAFAFYGTAIHKNLGVISDQLSDFGHTNNEFTGINDIGPDSFRNGAYCVIRKIDDELLIFNDFMGLYSVYFGIKNDILYIGNRLSLLSPLFKSAINTHAIQEYMVCGFNYSYRTIYKELFCLPPASRIHVKNRVFHIERVDKFSTQAEYPKTMSCDTEEISALLSSSVKSIYDSNLKYSLSITGGMDSRLIYLNWPDRQSLLTETAGAGTSDYLKAKQIIQRIGNPGLHVLEDLKEANYTGGFAEYYNRCDNPLHAFDQFNYEHLKWKMERGSNIHLSGVGGELLDGENLYLSRKPYYVLSEAVRGYSYHSIHHVSKPELIAGVLGIQLSKAVETFLDSPAKISTSDLLDDIVSTLDGFLGVTKYAECFTERFRTYRLANAGYNMTGSLDIDGYFSIMPFNDSELIQYIVRFHPSTRELRKLAISILRQDSTLKDIPTDTTHLPVGYPYKMQRFMRAVRMVTNIGFQKKIPLIQKGEAPKFRAFPYFDQDNKEFRSHMRSVILSSVIFDKKKVVSYLNDIEKIRNYNFYVTHGAEGTLLKLYRLARAVSVD